MFRKPVAERAPSSAEDGGVVSEGVSATVPYLLGNCCFPSWSTTLQLLLSTGEQWPRIVSVFTTQSTVYGCLFVVAVRESVGGQGKTRLPVEGLLGGSAATPVAALSLRDNNTISYATMQQ